MAKSHVRLLVFIGALATILTCGAEPKSSTAEWKPYRIVDGKVDTPTYLGWRAFHSACHACHGVDATGTSVAPNLVERIRNLSPRDFSIKVLHSYRVVLPSGEAQTDDPSALREEFLNEVLRRERGELIMPAWEDDPKIRPYLIDLYAYLRARGDGALGPGRPQRIWP